MSGTAAGGPRLRTRSRSEFRADMADVAAELRRRIEADVTGLDNSPEAIADRRRQALAPDGFAFFCRTYFPHYIRNPQHRSRLHDYLYRRLPEILTTTAGQNDVIAAPRGEAKSTICSQLFPLWCIARRAKHYVLILMDAFDQAAVMLEAIKAELVSNPRLAHDFPDICGQGRVWKEGVIVTASGVKIEGVGSGKRLRGRRHGPHRPDLAVLDDIENDDNVRSPEQRDKLEGWVDKAVLNVGAADGSLDVIYIGTTLHYDGVLARKQRNPLWRAAKFASIVRWPDAMDLWDRWEEVLRNDGPDAADALYASRKPSMDAGAIVSWPGVRPLVALMKLRVKVGHAAFDSEQQNDPVSSTDALFGTVTFWVDRLADWVFFGACDPSLGKQNRARDPSAVLIGGLNRETGVLDVVEALIRRRLPDRIIEDIITMEEEYRCLRWAIESVQFQEFFRTSLIARGQARGVPVPAVPVIPLGDKGLRIERLQPHVANGVVRFHAGHTALLDQLRHYPMTDHDDGLDALEMLWMTAIGRQPSAGATSARPPGKTAGGMGAAMFGRRSVAMRRMR
ncbi:phage terminase large subunit [Humitalea sp. 24SJ18S-53]|uniref:phage terminase large subunit n=1 Tax=Humitalea sp. 24SJ18S-53 TaxID=3422307 RepID=UPI003D66AE30